MKIAKILILVIVGLFVLAAINLTVPRGFAAAPCGDSCTNSGGPSGNTTATNECDKVNSSTQLTKCVQSNKIIVDLQNIVNFLSAGVGIVIIGMIILGGIQYSAAGDNQQGVASAKQRITNAFIALAIYLFMFAFLQWLIPGGVFG
jgi:uncharacterized membrane protein YraQ (UPF0718 family)